MLTGFGPIQQDSARLSEQDLIRAETVSLPIAALVLILVFGSLIAAGMPLAVAGLAIPTSVGIINIVAQQREMSIYVLNIATMLGLALAIDYSLFITSRFREELARGRSVEQAVERAVGTAGKAVLFSGIAVAIGLSGLLWFQASALTSIGLGGAIVVLASVVYSLTFLPAILGMLGPRVNALSVGGLLRRLGLRRETPGTVQTSRWAQVAHAVMRRPIVVLVPVLAFLLLARLAVPAPAAGHPGRDGQSARRAEPRRLGRAAGGVPCRRDDADRHPARYRRRGHERGHDRRGRDARRPPGGARGRRPCRGAVHVRGPGDRCAAAACGGRAAVRGTAGLAVARSGGRHCPAPGDLHPRHDRSESTRSARYNSANPAATAMISEVRAVALDAPLSRMQVGGGAAIGEDFLVSQSERIPWAVGTTLHRLGDHPVPAVRLDRHPDQGRDHDPALAHRELRGARLDLPGGQPRASLLDFEPLGYTIAGNPIIMFAVLIGLSMDYEVLLLSRVQEAYRRTGDNAAAVADGLARTAGVITGAALIMVTVFAAFALADTITIKSIGVGMALAVALDATIIRVLLVPATMRLLGHWNWWAPGPLGRIAERFGFSHVEDEEDLAAASGSGTSTEDSEPASAPA